MDNFMCMMRFMTRVWTMKKSKKNCNTMEHGWFMALKMRNSILNILVKKVDRSDSVQPGPSRGGEGKKLYSRKLEFGANIPFKFWSKNSKNHLKWVFVTLEKFSGQNLSSFLKIAFFAWFTPYLWLINYENHPQQILTPSCDKPTIISWCGTEFFVFMASYSFDLMNPFETDQNVNLNETMLFKNSLFSV